MTKDEVAVLSVGAAVARRAMLAFAATNGSLADATAIVLARYRDRTHFVEASAAVDGELDERPDDPILRRTAELFSGLLRADIWDSRAAGAPDPPGSDDDSLLAWELREIRAGIKTMINMRYSLGFDEAESRRWDRLTRREAALLARLGPIATPAAT